MNHPTRTLQRVQRAGSFYTGVLIGAAAWTPAFAASPNLPEQWQPYLLIGSVVLLAVALTLKAIGKRAAGRRVGIAAPTDMRDANRVEMIDVPLHQ